MVGKFISKYGKNDIISGNIVAIVYADNIDKEVEK
jgi:hypothetical protein